MFDNIGQSNMLGMCKYNWFLQQHRSIPIDIGCCNKGCLLLIYKNILINIYLNIFNKFLFTCLTVCSRIACGASTCVTCADSHTWSTIAAWIFTARIYYLIILYFLKKQLGFNNYYLSYMFDNIVLNNKWGKCMCN